jgi:hypothetical protein
VTEENFFTDIELSFKQLLGDVQNIAVNGEPVPVRIVTPDPDFIELELPSLTLQLTDFRRDPDRADNDLDVEKDLEEMTATVRKQSEPYNLHYTIGIHAEKSRHDRLLLGQVIYFIDEHPVVTTGAGREIFLHRDIAFRELSKERDLAKSIEIIVRIRLEARQAETVPLVQEHSIQSESI